MNSAQESALLQNLVELNKNLMEMRRIMELEYKLHCIEGGMNIG